MQQINDTSSIEEVLQYIVSEYGKEIYKDKQRLSNLISDLYTGEERLKRLYRRMIVEDAISQEIYVISLKPLQEQEAYLNKLVSRFTEANFYSEEFGMGLIESFKASLIPKQIEVISTYAHDGEGMWLDEFGVAYDEDGKRLRKQYRFIKQYIIKNGTIAVCDGAFYKCTSLIDITIPDGVICIGATAFQGCTNLTHITIPNSVTSISMMAFAECTGLTHITIPSNITSIAWGAFAGCIGLTNITIPNSVTSIEDHAFENCTGLTEITIPNKVTNIGDYAFNGCTRLAHITIPDSVTNIGSYAFCVKTHINVSSNNKHYKCINNVLFSYDLKIIIFHNHGIKTKLYSIPNSVINIGCSAFSECTLLTNIIIPDSVTSIGDDAFCNCIGLISITIPNSITYVGFDIFYGCNNLKTIIIPKDSFARFQKLLPEYAHLLKETT